jgi:hypothetical protein
MVLGYFWVYLGIFQFSLSFLLSAYLSSDLTTLEEFRKITKMKIIFRGVRPDQHKGKSSQAFHRVVRGLGLIRALKLPPLHSRLAVLLPPSRLEQYSPVEPSVHLPQRFH